MAHPDVIAGLDRAVAQDCWNRIGVQGDRSCPELKRYVHCRNCHVFSAGAADRLDGDPPGNYLAAWTRHFAEPRHATDSRTHSFVIFRIGVEWLALPTAVVSEVANLRPIHSLPHRHNSAVLGLVNIRGELLVCVSLGHVLGVEPSATTNREHRTTPRLLVIRREDVRVAGPVDEVHGIHHASLRELKEVPATVAKATVTYSTALLSWRTHSVGILDDQLVFHSLQRSLG